MTDYISHPKEWYALGAALSRTEEELVRQRFELPAFDALERAARKVRASLARQLHRRVHAALSPAARLRIDALFIAALATRRTPWNELKEDPGRPTRTHLKESIARERWLSARNVGTAVFSDVPAVWVEYLAHAGRNYYPFLWRAYRGYRATLFTLLSALTLRSTTQETALEEALQFPRANAGRSGRWLSMVQVERTATGALHVLRRARGRLPA